jgi:putative tricarboxylic transport membrane protein
MADRILGALCVILGGAMAWAARGYAAEISYEPVGPRAFPLLLAAILVLIGAWMVVKGSPRTAPQRGVDAQVSGLGAAEAATAVQGTPLRGNLTAVVLCAGAVLVYAALFRPLGFVLATTLMAVPVGKAFGGQWKKCLVGGLAMGLGMFFLFDKLLDVILPTGVLSFILGGR